MARPFTAANPSRSTGPKAPGSTATARTLLLKTVRSSATTAATALSIASAGGYTKPTRLTISADLNLDKMVGSTDPHDATAGATHVIPRGITLGFFNVGGCSE